MSIESDIRSIIRKKYEQELKNRKFDYKEWLLKMAEKAGLTSEKYDFKNLLEELIEKIKFLDTRKNLDNFSDTDTLSRFMSWLESEGEKNTDIGKGMALKLNSSWQEAHDELIDYGFIQQFQMEFNEFEQKMKDAYLAHTKFEQILNDGDEPKERYYSFFQLNEKEDELLDAITFNEETLKVLMEETDLIKMRIIQKGNQEYGLSLGINGSVQDIIDQIVTLNAERGEPLNLVRGIYRDEIDQRGIEIDQKEIGLSTLRTEYSQLYQAANGPNRRLITTTGGMVGGNRITELLFNSSAVNHIISINNPGSYQMYLDQLSSLVGSDVTYRSGARVSVKTFGKSDVIQLLQHGSMQTVDQLFYNRIGRNKEISVRKNKKIVNSLEHTIDQGIKKRVQLNANQKSRIIDEKTLEAKKEFSERIQKIKLGLQNQGLEKNESEFELKDFIANNIRTSLLSLSDEDFLREYNAYTGGDLFSDFKNELMSSNYDISGIVKTARQQMRNNSKLEKSDALRNVLGRIREIEGQYASQIETQTQEEIDKLIQQDLMLEMPTLYMQA